MDELAAIRVFTIVAQTGCGCSTGGGGSFFGMGRNEITATHDMAAGTPYELEVQLERERSDGAMSGLNVGAYPPQTGDSVADAVDLAATADLSILVVGTNDDWESEGWDRDDLDLPGRQDELIQRVADVSARTVVVVNAGSPVKMPWLDAVDAVVVAWFPGQEFGDALADVLFGDVEPQGRLPITFPRRMEDTPAFEHHPGRNGIANYGERRLIGYRWYDTVGREPLFPFGHGLGYAVTEIAGARLIDHHTVEVDVSNTSDREGYEVVQVYAHRVDRGGLEPDEPAQRLVGFTKLAVPANGRSTASVALDPRCYQGWDVAGGAWTEMAGSYELRVGRSSRDITERLPVER
jgi:beta-glucosidase